MKLPFRFRNNYKKATPRSLQHLFSFAILRIHLIVLIITIVVSSGIVFLLYRAHFIRQSQNSLSFMVTEIDNFAENMQSIQKNFMLDNVFQEYLKSPQVYTGSDINLLQDVIDKSLLMISSYYYIDSITIFQNDNSIVSIAENHRIYIPKNEVLAVQDTEAYRNLSKYSPLTWGGVYQNMEMFPSQFVSLSSHEIIPFLLTLPNLKENEAYSVLSINVDTKYFESILSQNLHEECFSSLYNQSGELLLTTQTETFHPSIGDIVLTQELTNTDWKLEFIIPFTVLLRNMLPLMLTVAALFLLASLTATWVSVLTSRRILNPFVQIIGQIDQISTGNLEQRLSHQEYQELDTLCNHFNNMLERIQQLMQSNQDYVEEKRLLEIQMLQAQINPHFIQNSLTTIRWMASMARAQNVCQALLALSNVLTSVFATKDIFWSLKSEQSFLQNYVNIMDYRIGNKTKLNFEIPEEFQERPVLRFLLQPVVENALMHGLFSNHIIDSPGEISIHVQKQEEWLDIYVTDNGKGISSAHAALLNENLRTGRPTTKKSNRRYSIGMSNVHRRIVLQYGEGTGLEIQPQPLGTCVRIRLRL